MLLRFISDRNGSTAIEYGLIAALIAIAIIPATIAMSASVNEIFTRVADWL